MNVDSNSSDGTAKIFTDTKTKHPKHSIIVTKENGKGKNILEFCNFVLSQNIDFCLTIDADITSADPEWVIKLLTPLIEKNAVYVTPIYERSRFEGSSTNHFTFPLIYALTGRVIRQPIAGDFAFSRKVVQAILGHDLVSDTSIQKYGIDIFMTLTAISTGGIITQVGLGKKLHAPSFNKLEFMFPQIAASALLSNSTSIFPNETYEGIDNKNNFLSNSNFTHKKAAGEMKDRALAVIKSTRNKDWVSKKIVTELITALEKNESDETMMVMIWTTILSNWIKYFHYPSITTKEAERAAQELLPFFVLRATNFWFWAETRDIMDVENAIKYQAQLLRAKMKIV